MSVVSQLLRAELLALRTTRVPWAVLGSMARLVMALVVLTVATGDRSSLDGERGVLLLGHRLGTQLDYRERATNSCV